MRSQAKSSRSPLETSFNSHRFVNQYLLGTSTLTKCDGLEMSLSKPLAVNVSSTQDRRLIISTDHVWILFEVQCFCTIKENFLEGSLKHCFSLNGRCYHLKKSFVFLIKIKLMRKFQETQVLETGEIAQWVKQLPCTHEDSSLSPQDPHNCRISVVALQGKCGLGKLRQGIMGTIWRASLAQSTSSGFSWETLSQ